jgi:hypothetical protein
MTGGSPTGGGAETGAVVTGGVVAVIGVYVNVVDAMDPGRGGRGGG